MSSSSCSCLLSNEDSGFSFTRTGSVSGLSVYEKCGDYFSREAISRISASPDSFKLLAYLKLSSNNQEWDFWKANLLSHTYGALTSSCMYSVQRQYHKDFSDDPQWGCQYVWNRIKYCYSGNRCKTRPAALYGPVFFIRCSTSVNLYCCMTGHCAGVYFIPYELHIRQHGLKNNWSSKMSRSGLNDNLQG